jgi:hypothetical protein
MIKHTYFRNFMAIATPSQREIATAHFNQLWERYHMQTEYDRLLFQNRLITLTTFRKSVAPRFRELRQELRGIIKVLK